MNFSDWFRTSPVLKGNALHSVRRLFYLQITVCTLMWDSTFYGMTQKHMACSHLNCYGLCVCVHVNGVGLYLLNDENSIWHSRSWWRDLNLMSSFPYKHPIPHFHHHTSIIRSYYYCTGDNFCYTTINNSQTNI